MRNLLVLLAALVVLAVNLGTVVSARRSRSAPSSGPMELTERELRLPALIGDSTVLLLDLRWEMARGDQAGSDDVGWLTTPKLQELGFDCTLPLTNTHARTHYQSLGLRPVYVVLEYEGDAWRQAERQRKVRTHLFAIDAGRDPERLRERYPDRTRHILVRGLVRLFFETHVWPEGKPLPEPRLRGRIVELLPGAVFVPPPYCATLQKLRQPPGDEAKEAAERPRFAATLSWGGHHEPWISSVRLLP